MKKGGFPCIELCNKKKAKILLAALHVPALVLLFFNILTTSQLKNAHFISVPDL